MSTTKLIVILLSVAGLLEAVLMADILNSASLNDNVPLRGDYGNILTGGAYNALKWLATGLIFLGIFAAVGYKSYGAVVFIGTACLVGGERYLFRN